MELNTQKQQRTLVQILNLFASGAGIDAHSKGLSATVEPASISYEANGKHAHRSFRRISTESSRALYELQSRIESFFVMEAHTLILC